PGHRAGQGAAPRAVHPGLRRVGAGAARGRDRGRGLGAGGARREPPLRRRLRQEVGARPRAPEVRPLDRHRPETSSAVHDAQAHVEPRTRRRPMNKIERVRATLAGEPADRPPFTVWYHFGTQHSPAARAASVHLEFLEAYDFDLLKVMNDYDYPMPEGIDTLATADDLALLRPFEPRDAPLGAQLEVVEAVAHALSGRALFL